MPVIGTTAYNTAGQITSLVRSLLNDAAGNLFIVQPDDRVVRKVSTNGIITTHMIGISSLCGTSDAMNSLMNSHDSHSAVNSFARRRS